MKTKGHIFVLLVFLLIVEVIYPISAWTLLDTYTSPGGINDNSGFVGNGITVNNAIAFENNITLIKFLGTCQRSYASVSGAPTGSHVFQIYDTILGPTGNLTVTWNADYGVGQVPCEMNFGNFEYVRGTATGQRTFRLYDPDTSYYVGNYLGWFWQFATDDSHHSVDVNGVWSFKDNAYGTDAHNSESYGGSFVAAPVAAFSCVPTSQFPDTPVVCTDTSTNTPTDWYWTLDAENLGVKGWQTSTSQNFTWQSHYPGLYSVNLRANNSAGGDWENKTNYVSISVNATPNNCNLPLASGYSRTLFQCTNAGSDAAISGCNLQLHDMEGGTWSNITNSGDGRWCIDTLPLHHINGYGQATGYISGSRLNVQEWNGMIYTISMIPGYLTLPQAGKIWVYVYAHDFDTGQNLVGATVSLSGTGLPTVVGTTGTDGGVGIQWPNVSTAYINVAKSGYTTGVKVITTSSFGPDAVTVDLHKGSQTATITPTPPWSGVTTAPTLDPAGNPGDEGYSNAKGQEMMDFLAQHGMDLVSLCLLVTIIGLLKMAAKK